MLVGVRFKDLRVRCAELWEYGVGGGLEDDYHYDTDSIVTVVVLLKEADEGGAFRTLETDGENKVWDLEVGEGVAFLSHKYHNITPVTRGTRESLVVEFWEGGDEHEGR
mmetsp:Transcript_4009/g.7589  ORF Transcript_4009/g.7589 Transcript_4009/m.7589 type:complete len:109 (-) Transcript_4009:49-375(-)